MTKVENLEIMYRPRKAGAPFKLWGFMIGTWEEAMDLCASLEKQQRNGEYLPMSATEPHDIDAAGLGFLPQWVRA